MKGRQKNNKQRQTNHRACKSSKGILHRTLGDKYHALPKSLNTPPPPKNKSNNHKIHTK